MFWRSNKRDYSVAYASCTEYSIELDGDMIIDDMLELVGIDEESFECESSTVGGWCVESFGTWPKEGDSFDFENLHVTVLAMDNLRVERVLVKIEPKIEEE